MRMFARTTVLALALTVPTLGFAQDGAAQRVVSIGGSLTEIVYALGQEDRLVARDTTSLFPAAALDLPDVGYMRALSPEGVLSVEPDLILALEGAGPPETIDVLEGASVPVVSVPETYDREGVLAKIEAVGAALGVEEQAAALAETVGRDLATAEAAAEAVDEPVGVLFVLSMEGGRVMASGLGTAANGIIELAGGRNVVTDYQGYKQLTDEAIITAAPDVILMMDRGGGSDDPHAAGIEGQAALAATPAGEAGRVVRMDGNYLLGFGPRTGEAARELAAALHDVSHGD